MISMSTQPDTYPGGRSNPILYFSKIASAFARKVESYTAVLEKGIGMDPAALDNEVIKEDMKQAFGARMASIICHMYEDTARYIREDDATRQDASKIRDTTKDYAKGDALSDYSCADSDKDSSKDQSKG